MTARRTIGRPGSDLPAVFLYPATMYCTAAPTVVTTVLGSCVAVSLTDRRRRISGLNHYLLPSAEPGEPSLRHGETAIPLLFGEMLRLGCQPEDIEAKIFGGAAVLPVGRLEGAVGSRNIAVALDSLRRSASRSWRVAPAARAAC